MNCSRAEGFTLDNNNNMINVVPDSLPHDISDEVTEGHAQIWHTDALNQ